MFLHLSDIFAGEKSFTNVETLFAFHSMCSIQGRMPTPAHTVLRIKEIKTRNCGLVLKGAGSRVRPRDNVVVLKFVDGVNPPQQLN